MAYSSSIPHATLENPATSASVQLERMHHDLQQTQQMVRMLSDQLMAIGSLVQGRGGKGEALDEWVCDRVKCLDEDKAAPSEPRAAALPVVLAESKAAPVELKVTPPEPVALPPATVADPEPVEPEDLALFDEADDWPLDATRGR